MSLVLFVTYSCNLLFYISLLRMLILQSYDINLSIEISGKFDRLKNVQVDNDQENSQSKRISHSKNRGGKKIN